MCCIKFSCLKLYLFCTILALELISWYAWDVNSERRTVKTVKEGTLDDAINTLEEQIPSFLEHCFIKQRQSDYFQDSKNNVSEKKCLLQVDFSENFTIMQQDEVQSAHWTNDQVSIYTAVAHTITGAHSYALISNYMQHDKIAVHTFHSKLFEDLKKKFPKLECVDIFSDGAGQHFKQRYTLCNMTYGMEDHNLKLDWHFFATSHGKGAMDGVGGMLKHHVWQKVKARKAFVTDAMSFYQCASTISEKVTVMYVDDAEVKSQVAKLEKRWDDILALPKTHETHCVRTEGQNTVKYSMTSITDGKVFSFRKKCLDAVAGPSSITVAGPNVKDIQFGKWVLVELTSDRGSAHQFVGQIIGQTNDNNITVKFLKKSGQKYIWPIKEDIDDVQITQIMKVLSEPSTDSREKLYFSELP